MEHLHAADLLFRCAAGGDSRAWEEFRDRFEGRLRAGILATLRRHGASTVPEDREDLLQEVYCRLLSHGGRILKRCRGGSEVEVAGYLRRVAESVVIDHLRAVSATKRGRCRLTEAGEGGGTALLERAPDPAPSPEQRALHAELRRLFLARSRRAAGRRDPRRNLRILCLALLEGWTSREIARRLGGGVSVGTVDSLIHRMRQRLSAEGLAMPSR